MQRIDIVRSLCVSAMALIVSFALSWILFAPGASSAPAVRAEAPSVGETRSAPPSPAAPDISSGQAQAQNVWTLLERGGRVVVTHNGADAMLTDIAPHTLRAADKELLAAGIEASSFDDILMLIEDFSS